MRARPEPLSLLSPHPLQRTLCSPPQRKTVLVQIPGIPPLHLPAITPKASAPRKRVADTDPVVDGRPVRIGGAGKMGGTGSSADERATLFPPLHGTHVHGRSRRDEASPARVRLMYEGQRGHALAPPALTTARPSPLSKPRRHPPPVDELRGPPPAAPRRARVRQQQMLDDSEWFHQLLLNHAAPRLG